MRTRSNCYQLMSFLAKRTVIVTCNSCKTCTNKQIFQYRDQLLREKQNANGVHECQIKFYELYEQLSLCTVSFQCFLYSQCFRMLYSSKYHIVKYITTVFICIPINIIQMGMCMYFEMFLVSYSAAPYK